MNLHDAQDQLYSGAPEDFVATRTQLVKQARVDGHSEAAAAIAALRRPNTAAGLLNLLSRRDPDAVAALRTIGDLLRSAQRAGNGEAIRTLGAKRREVMASAMRTVAALAGDRGQVLSAAVRADVESSLAAAILDVGSADELAAGRLSEALHKVGFGDWALASGPDSDSPSTQGAPQPSRPALRAVPDLAMVTTSNRPSRAMQKAQREQNDQAREASRHAVRVARAEKAAAALELAQDRAAAAQHRVDRLDEQIDQLRGELVAATAEARRANEAQRKASRDAATAARRLAAGLD